jgi:hypothetical protein
VGTLIPASLFCATSVGDLTAGWSRNRLTIFLACLFVIPVLAFCFWFRASSYRLIMGALILLVVFVWVWWKATSFWGMAVSSAILWAALVGLLFPSLGVNEVPAEVFRIIDQRKIFLFREPQPAMLPIAKGRSMELVVELEGVAQQCGETPLIFSLRAHSISLQNKAAALNLNLHEVYNYKVVLALEKLVSSALNSSAASKWQLALRRRSLEPLKTEIALFEVLCAANDAGKNSPRS